jgi:hypothetical protein
LNILLITDEVWNDKLYSNNVLTNWFDGLSVNLANLYLASGIPDNPCCSNYFQITDSMMIKSVLTQSKAGQEFIVGDEKFPAIKSSEENPFVIDFLRLHPLESFRFMKDLIWVKGEINTESLDLFLEDFKPDIVFSLRMASLKVLSVERLVWKLTNAPMVCFTGDDEYTLKQLRFSPIFWIRRFLLRKNLKESAKYYDKYYTLSKEQAELYKKRFDLDTKVLMKCKDMKEDINLKEVHEPIKLIYAGRLYCNRYKTLKLIKEALVQINRNQVEMILDIYTKDKISSRKRKMLQDGINSVLHPGVSAKELEEIYREGDIALHVESFDYRMKLLTKYSFSTKIIDCLSSTCSVIAIGPKKNSGIAYLKDKKAAICITKPEDIERVFKKIASNKNGLIKYQKRAIKCVKKYHNQSEVQKDLLRDFEKVIENFKKRN